MKSKETRRINRRALGKENPQDKSFDKLRTGRWALGLWIPAFAGMTHLQETPNFMLGACGFWIAAFPDSSGLLAMTRAE
jgi:hypothetical protein